MLFRLRHTPALCAALAVLALASVGLTLSAHRPPVRFGRAAAISAVTGDAAAAATLRQSGWDRASVGAVDAQLERVSFYQHGKIVFEAALDRHGSVRHAYSFSHRPVPYGNPLAYEPPLLIGLCLLFVLMGGVVPARRLRNLDVLALLSFLAPVILLQKRYIDASVITALPGLVYLAARCAAVALRPAARAPESTPLYLKLTGPWTDRERVRVLRILLAALVAVFVMVGVSSTAAVDVVYAVMEGATKLLHGALPYGHMPGDIVHGDTYPVLSYLLYAPLAAVSPVGSTWDSVDLALGATVLAALAVAGAAFAFSAGPRRRHTRRSAEAQMAGLRAALVWLSFPPLLITVSSGTTDVVLGAMLAFAVVLWRVPAASAAVLAAAGWFKLAPFALVPIWLAPRRGRQLARTVAVIAGSSLAMVALVLAIGGSGGLLAMAHALGYQFERGSPQSPWAALGTQSLQPIGQAVVLALIAGACVQLRRDPELATRERIAALAAAVLLGLQVTADYWAFLYVVWAVPLLAFSLLSDRAPVASVVEARTQPEPGPVRLAGQSLAPSRG